MSPQKPYRVTLDSRDVPHFLAACERTNWHALDTGERVMTDEGPDAEAVLLLEPRARALARTAAAIST